MYLTTILFLYIYFARLSVFCGTSHDPREGLWTIKSSKISLQQNLISIKLKKATIFFYKIRESLLFFVLQCLKWVIVYNWNRRWAQKPSFIYFNCFIYLTTILSRYGPVQSVRVLPRREERDGSSSTSVTVAFIDITSALKARQSEHKFDER